MTSPPPYTAVPASGHESIERAPQVGAHRKPADKKWISGLRRLFTRGKHGEELQQQRKKRRLSFFRRSSPKDSGTMAKWRKSVFLRSKRKKNFDIEYDFFRQVEPDFVVVSECPVDDRLVFVRRVYAILLVQLIPTCVVASLAYQAADLILWAQSHDWVFSAASAATLGNVALLIAYQHDYPKNFLLLALFTLLQASTLGLKLASLDAMIVLQALAITTGVFLGLLLFTFQSKFDFTDAGPFLYSWLISLVIVGIGRSYFPFGCFANILHVLGGIILFSTFVVYYTNQIMESLSPREYIWGSFHLYIAFLSLFIYILRLLASLQDGGNEEQKEKEKKAEEDEKKKEGNSKATSKKSRKTKVK